jgi:hypothetical protein
MIPTMTMNEPDERPPNIKQQKPAILDDNKQIMIVVWLVA